MAMLIRFTNTRHGPAMTCTRDDGSIAGMKDRRHGEFFVRHDLMHYAVETVLGMRGAFWGLLAGLDGRTPWSIADFQAQGVSRRLPGEAIVAEIIVGRFDLIAVPHDGAIDAAELNDYLRNALRDHPTATAALPELSSSQIENMLHMHSELMVKYRALPEGGHMELRFP